MVKWVIHFLNKFIDIRSGRKKKKNHIFYFCSKIDTPVPNLLKTKYQMTSALHRLSKCQRACQLAILLFISLLIAKMGWWVLTSADGRMRKWEWKILYNGTPPSKGKKWEGKMKWRNRVNNFSIRTHRGVTLCRLPHSAGLEASA